MDPTPTPPITTTTITALAAAATTTTTTDSVNSSPRSKNTDSNDDSSQPVPGTAAVPKLRLLCSFGGHIVPRPHDKSLCYIGGDTRIVVVDRHSSLSELTHRLSKTLLDCKANFTLKYQLPNEDLDSFISVMTDEDLENMIEEYDRLNNSSVRKSSRLRLFLFPPKAESIGSLLENSTKSVDWFVNALNGTSSGGISNSNSVSCFLGLDDDAVIANNRNILKGPGGGGGGGGSGTSVNKKQDIQSVPDSPMLDRTLSFESASSAPSLGNLPPIRVQVQEDQQQKAGIEEQVAQMTVGGNGNQRSDDGGLVSMSSPSAEVKESVAVAVVSLSSAPVVEDYNRQTLANDERSVHGATGYQQQLQQQQAHLMTSQLHQKPGGGGLELASSDSVSSDASITNSLSRQKPMIYQQPNAHYSSVQSRVSAPVEQKITDINSRVQMQQQFPDSGYLLPTQFDPQHHQQLHQQHPQFIQAGAQYIQHLPAGAMAMPSYYPVYSSQQQQHSRHPEIDHQQYPVYFVPARQPQAYSMGMQQPDYGEAGIATHRSQTSPPAVTALPSTQQYNVDRNTTAPISEKAASLYRTANTAAPAVVQVPSGQPHPQYVGMSQIHHPQTIYATSATTTSYSYEFADPTQTHIYYAQPHAPQMAAQYQTMITATPEAASQLPADNTNQQIRVSQP